jgi:hypothetical protein
VADEDRERDNWTRPARAAPIADILKLRREMEEKGYSEPITHIEVDEGMAMETLEAHGWEEIGGLWRDPEGGGLLGLGDAFGIQMKRGLEIE